MIALLQRVSEARVEVDDQVVALIGAGIVAMIAVEPSDICETADRLLERIAGYRMFPDRQGRMNLGLNQIGADLLLIPQFTLAADTSRGLRAGFSPAAPPQQARALFDYMVKQANGLCAQGKRASAPFGIDMDVTLTNRGPVTFWIQQRGTS